MLSASWFFGCTAMTAASFASAVDKSSRCRLERAICRFFDTSGRGLSAATFTSRLASVGDDGVVRCEAAATATAGLEDAVAGFGATAVFAVAFGATFGGAFGETGTGICAVNFDEASFETTGFDVGALGLATFCAASGGTGTAALLAIAGVCVVVFSACAVTLGLAAVGDCATTFGAVAGAETSDLAIAGFCTAPFGPASSASLSGFVITGVCATIFGAAAGADPLG